jgi:hypothetical protein
LRGSKRVGVTIPKKLMVFVGDQNKWVILIASY